MCVCGYEILFLVSTSLKLSNLLKPNNGFYVKICFTSSQFSIIFQFEYMIFFIFGFVGLHLVIITGSFLELFFYLSFKRSAWVNFETFL